MSVAYLKWPRKKSAVKIRYIILYNQFSIYEKMLGQNKKGNCFWVFPRISIIKKNWFWKIKLHSWRYLQKCVIVYIICLNRLIPKYIYFRYLLLSVQCYVCHVFDRIYAGLSTKHFSTHVHIHFFLILTSIIGSPFLTSWQYPV